MTRFRVAAGVATCVIDGVAYVAPLPDGPILVLEGVACLIWTESLAGPRDTLSARVSTATGAPVDEVDSVVTEFVDALVGRGLLREQAS